MTREDSGGSSICPEDVVRGRIRGRAHKDRRHKVMLLSGTWGCWVKSTTPEIIAFDVQPPSLRVLVSGLKRTFTT
jgi:hypothetical protein